MKTIMGVLALALVAGAGLAASMALANEGGGQEQVTLCHAAGLAGTTQYVTLTVAHPAAFGPAGHFDENGTPNAGHEQDYLGACEGDTTDTTPTTTTPTVPDDDNPCPAPPCTPGGFTNPTPTTPESSPPTGAATAICDRGSFLYRVSGTIDGQAADSVSPPTIPGATNGTTNVTVTRGDTSFRTSVTTNGDCAPPSTSSTTTPPPANSTQPTTPPVTPPGQSTTTPGPTPGPPAAATPGQPSSTPKAPAKATPAPQGAPVTPAPGKPCPTGTRAYQGKCHAVVEGSG